MSSEIAVFDRISDMVDGEYNADQIMVVQETVAKGTTVTELGYFLNVCRSVGLNPFNREIWCYKDYKGGLVMFTGRDGFLSMAQKNPLFNGMRSFEVCENDTFAIDIANNVIKHEVSFGNRGRITGGVAIVFRKDGEPTIELANFDTYYKGLKNNGEKIKTSPWNTAPEEMIKKVAESHALKKAFGLTGVSSEYDYSTSNGIAVPVGAEQPQEPLLGEEKLSIVIDCMSKSDVIREAVLGKYKSAEMMPENQFDGFMNFAKGVLNETI